jgi:glycosyltransferase involved in cell wall biosynthesis
VHWVSPLPPAQTDIAHYTARILPELAAETDLTLWTDTQGWDPALEAHCPVRRFDPEHILPRDFTGPGQGDVLFLNIGNSWVFHSKILRLAQRIPGVIVLHDMAIQEMLYDCVRFAGHPPDRYGAGMQTWYGAQGKDWAEAVLAQDLQAHELAHLAPGFELAMDRAISVLTHTEIAYEAVTARQVLPAWLLDLPFAPGPRAPRARRAAKGPLRLVQFGHIGPNRRIEAVLDTLATLKGEISFHLDVMGQIWDTPRIRAQIAALDLGDRVTLHGFVEEDVLDATLARAHLVLNLRYPTMGESSGSQLRIWNAAAAAAVSDLGWYQSLPDDTVFKIPHEGEQAALSDLLRRLHADRSLGEDIGRAGRARLKARHTPARYAKAIAAIARQAQSDAPTALRARSATRLLHRSTGASHALLQNRLARQID